MKTDEKASATQYANAILQLTDESGDARTVFTNLEAFSRAMKFSPEIAVLFKHPAISAPARVKLLEEATKDMDKLSHRVLELLCERRQMNLLPAIMEEFYELLRSRQNIVKAQLICAEEIAEDEKNSIIEKLSHRLNKKIDLNVSIDKSLIGGYILKIKDQVIDGSLKGRLNSIEKSLLSV